LIDLRNEEIGDLGFRVLERKLGALLL